MEKVGETVHPQSSTSHRHTGEECRHQTGILGCRLGLMFMPDPVRMLKAIRRVLKPGGKASAVVWGPPEKAPFFSVPMKAVSKHLPDIKRVPPGTPGGPFGIPSQEMLGGIFTKAGF